MRLHNPLQSVRWILLCIHPMMHQESGVKKGKGSAEKVKFAKIAANEERAIELFSRSTVTRHTTNDESATSEKNEIAKLQKELNHMREMYNKSETRV